MRDQLRSYTSLSSVRISRFVTALLVIAFFTLPNLSFAAIVVTTTANATSIGRYDVYELTMANGGTYANPWEDVVISATFSTPSGKAISVGGFYYDTGTWKLRFAPQEIGTYTWTLNFTAGGQSYSTTGSFSASGSSQSGFLRQHPVNKLRLQTEGDGKIFFPVGTSDAPSDWYNAATKQENNVPGFTPDGHVDYCLGAEPIRCPTTIDDYFSTMTSMGKMNLYRYNGESLNDISLFNSGGKNSYRVDIGKTKDDLAVHLHQYGVKSIWAFMALPNNYAPGFDLSNSAIQSALLRAHQYAINRWGAYVDVWELMNEGSGVPTAYYDTVTSYILANDPYQHLITTSYSPSVAHPRILVNSPHLYYDTPTYSPSWSLDREIVSGSYGISAGLSKFPNRPQIWGEVGNRGTVYSNYDPERYRIFTWVYFTNEASPVFWDTSFQKGYFGGLNNMYIGNEERGFSTIFAQVVSDLDPLAGRLSATSNNAKIHSYLLGSSSDILGYLLNSADRSSISGATLTVNIPTAGMRGQWINPSTGAVVSSFLPSMGSQALAVPTFTSDLLLRIKSAGSSQPDTLAPAAPTALVVH